MIDKELSNGLLSAAKQAILNSYAKYSNFHVGAACLAGGKIYSGANIENASYSLTICAERSAIFAAINDGQTKIDAVCVYHDGNTLPYPCGACLQVISEFSSDAVIIIASDNEIVTTSLPALLPGAFKLN